MTLPDKYTKPAVVLHWLIALGIFFNLTMLLYDDNARPRNIIGLHKSIGITVLGLVVLRLIWRHLNTPPAMPNYANWEALLSKIVHYALYAFMFILPLTGWLMNSASLNKTTGQPYSIDLFHIVPWFNLPFFQGMDMAARKGWHDFFEHGHGLTAWILMFLLVLHIAGALKHQFLDKEKELQRMWF